MVTKSLQLFGKEEKLVLAVFGYPELHDITSRNYFDPNKKQLTWRHISAALEFWVNCFLVLLPNSNLKKQTTLLFFCVHKAPKKGSMERLRLQNTRCLIGPLGYSCSDQQRLWWQWRRGGFRQWQDRREARQEWEGGQLSVSDRLSASLSRDYGVRPRRGNHLSDWRQTACYIDLLWPLEAQRVMGHGPVG